MAAQVGVGTLEWRVFGSPHVKGRRDFLVA